MDVEQIKHCLREFAKYSEKIGLQDIFIGDAIDANMVQIDSVEEGNKIYRQICCDIGITLDDEEEEAKNSSKFTPMGTAQIPKAINDE